MEPDQGLRSSNPSPRQGRTSYAEEDWAWSKPPPHSGKRAQGIHYLAELLPGIAPGPVMGLVKSDPHCHHLVATVIKYWPEGGREGGTKRDVHRMRNVTCPNKRLFWQLRR